MIPQLLHHLLGFLAGEINAAALAEAGNHVHELFTGLLILLSRAAAALKLFPGFGFAPGGLGLRGVIIGFASIKGGKIHMIQSFQFQSLGKENEIVNVLAAHGEQRDLPLQRGNRVKVRRVENPADFPQREFQLPEEQNRVQALKGRLVVFPIARLRHPAGAEQPDPVVMAQGSDGHVGSCGKLSDSHWHSVTSLQIDVLRSQSQHKP